MTNNSMAVPSTFGQFDVGEVFTHSDGLRYRVSKKTTTAIAATRFYWFTPYLDKITNWINGGPDVPYTP